MSSTRDLRPNTANLTHSTSQCPAAVPKPAGNDGTALTEALRLIEREIRDGLNHGFFRLTVKCQIVRGKKRRLTVTCGKSYQFTLPPDTN